jgi:hypothetical protein
MMWDGEWCVWVEPGMVFRSLLLGVNRGSGFWKYRMDIRPLGQEWDMEKDTPKNRKTTVSM